jgi:hypothetical protein
LDRFSKVFLIVKLTRSPSGGGFREAGAAFLLGFTGVLKRGVEMKISIIEASRKTRGQAERGNKKRGRVCGSEVLFGYVSILERYADLTKCRPFAYTASYFCKPTKLCN